METARAGRATLGLAHAQIAFDFAGPVVDAEHLAGRSRFAEFCAKR